MDHVKVGIYKLFVIFRFVQFVPQNTYVYAWVGIIIS